VLRKSSAPTAMSFVQLGVSTTPTRELRREATSACVTGVISYVAHKFESTLASKAELSYSGVARSRRRPLLPDVEVASIDPRVACNICLAASASWDSRAALTLASLMLRKAPKLKGLANTRVEVVPNPSAP